MRLDTNKLLKACDEWSKRIPEEDIRIQIPANDAKKRKYLGLSTLATDCQRAVFYNFRKIAKPAFDPKMLRLFQRGHREEFFFQHMLEGVGLKIYDVDPKTGEQFKVTDFEGHLSGHMDGIARDRKKLFVDDDEPFKVEYKTYNDSRYKTLVKKGVQESDVKYYGQMQGYLGYERRLGGALFCAVNKNTDELHFEWVPFNPSFFQTLQDRAEMVINSAVPPKGISGRRSFWKCKMCSYLDNCLPAQGEPRKPSIKSCRSCLYAEPAEEARWKCKRGREFGEVCLDWSDCNQG
jgi:hypothetical protein